MQNSPSKYVHLPLAFFFILQLPAARVYAKEQNLEELHAGIENLITSIEFDNEDLSKLQALPVESVALLADRLEKLQIGGFEEIRVFNCLANKLGQFQSLLLPEVKATAIRALNAKMADEGDQFHNYRVQLFDAGMAQTAVSLGTPLRLQSPVQRGEVETSEKSKRFQAITTMQREGLRMSSTEWTILSVCATTGVGFLWWLLKRKLSSRNLRNSKRKC